jgi:integrase
LLRFRVADMTCSGLSVYDSFTRIGRPGVQTKPHTRAGRSFPEGSTAMASKPFKKQTTSWKLGNQRVPPKTPGAEKIVIESAKWYGTVNGRHVPLCRDKQAAERMLRKLEADQGLARVGLGDPYVAHRSRPLAEHLKDYAAYLRAKADTEDHVKLTISRVRALFDGCGFTKPGDVDAGRAAEWITGLRQPAGPPAEIPPGKAEFTPAEAAALLKISGAGLRAAVKRYGLTATGQGKARKLPHATVATLVVRAARGCGPQTVNHYVRAIRGFFRWMVRAKRIGANPLDTLSLVNTQTDIRHGRRELTADELRRLLATTRASGRKFRGLSGEDRFHLYLTAATTGLRANALANLTPTDFDLNSDTATVTLAARFNKSRKSKVQPIPPDTASELRGYYSGPRKLDRRLSYTGSPGKGNRWRASGRVTRRRSRPRSPWQP